MSMRWRNLIRNLPRSVWFALTMRNPGCSRWVLLRWLVRHEWLHFKAAGEHRP